MEQATNCLETSFAIGNRRLPARVERLPTFMEVAGYPHYENVCSNVLAFYLDPEQPHGLGALVLDALAQVGNIAPAGEGMGGNVSVEHEVTTDAGNRIDILIESDTHTVVVENKIRAGVNNPFGDYPKYQERRTPEGREKHRFLLTLSPTDEGAGWGFANLTQTEFVAGIRAMLGRYISGADTRYLTLFLDFLNTLENLQKETRIDDRFVRLLSERSDEIEALLGEVKAFKDELRKRVQASGALVDVEEWGNVRQWFYRENTKVGDDLVHEVLVYDGMTVAIDINIDPTEWWIVIWERRGRDADLRELMQRLQIEVPPGEMWSFDFDENPEHIAPVLQDLVDRFATAGAVTG